MLACTLHTAHVYRNSNSVDEFWTKSSIANFRSLLRLHDGHMLGNLHVANVQSVCAITEKSNRRFIGFASNDRKTNIKSCKAIAMHTNDHLLWNIKMRKSSRKKRWNAVAWTKNRNSNGSKSHVQHCVVGARIEFRKIALLAHRLATVLAFYHCSFSFRQTVVAFSIDAVFGTSIWFQHHRQPN